MEYTQTTLQVWFCFCLTFIFLAFSHLYGFNIRHYRFTTILLKKQRPVFQLLLVTQDALLIEGFSWTWLTPVNKALGRLRKSMGSMPVGLSAALKF